MTIVYAYNYVNEQFEAETGETDQTTGHWVKYEDYESLETKYENLRQIVREAMRKLDLEMLDGERITCNDS